MAGKAVYHHTALSRDYGGYIPVGKEFKEPYSGRFGKGYVVYRHNPNSTYYCLKTYYIESED